MTMQRKWAESAEIGVDDTTGAQLVRQDSTFATPTAGSGQKMTCTLNVTNYTLTVVSGAAYRAAAENGTIYCGFAGTTVTDANKEIIVPAGTVSPVFIATGTTLNYSTEDGAGVTGRLSCVA